MFIFALQNIGVEGHILNSLAKDIINLDTGITIGDRKLFADDIALVAETVNDLQLLMNRLFSWCVKWRMKINNDKTNVVHFRPKNQKAAEHTFKLGEDSINVTDKYRYLGCFLTEFMNVNTIADNLADAGSRSLGKLIAKFYSNKGLGYKTYTKLYDTCVAPVMDYCSAIWGYETHIKLDRIHLREQKGYFSG